MARGQRIRNVLEALLLNKEIPFEDSKLRCYHLLYDDADASLEIWLRGRDNPEFEPVMGFAFNIDTAFISDVAHHIKYDLSLNTLNMEFYDFTEEQHQKHFSILQSEG